MHIIFLISGSEAASSGVDAIYHVIIYLGAFLKMLLFTQPTVYIDYLKQIFDPVDCTSPIHRLNEHVGTLKYADY